MEVRVRERLVGALVLVAIVVLVVPAILKGRGTEPAEPPGAQTRRVEVPIGNAPAAEDPGLVPETVLPDAMPEAVPAVQPPATEAVVRPPAKTADREAAAPRPAPPAASATTAASPPSPKPAVEQPQAAKAAPPPPAARQASPTQSAWAVQLGAYSTRDKADRFVADLKKRGFSAFVLEYRASGKVLYRVRVGPEQDRSRAEAIAARLAKEGYQPVVARHP